MSVARMRNARVAENGLSASHWRTLGFAAAGGAGAAAGGSPARAAAPANRTSRMMKAHTERVISLPLDAQAPRGRDRLAL